MHSCQDANILKVEDKRMEILITSLSGGLAEVKYHESKGYKSKNDESKDDKRHITVQFIHQSVNNFLLSYGLRILVRSLPGSFLLKIPNY